MSSSLREPVLERTFALYLGHVTYWIALMLPALLSAAAAFVLVRWAIGDVASRTEPVARALTVIPGLMGVIWLLATGVGAQALALVGAGEDAASAESRPTGAASTGATSAGAAATVRPMPGVVQVWMRLLARLPGALAVSTLVVVSVCTLGLIGLGLAAGVAWLPQGVLPRYGVTPGTARSLALLALLPALVAGSLPALWWLGRHASAIALQVVDGGSPWRTFHQARRLTRGHVVSLLGLLIVTTLASQALVLVARAAGSLLTLIVAPGRFRPIFGEGPLRSAAGLEVQVGATLLATFVTLPLILLPISIVALRLSKRRIGGD